MLIKEGSPYKGTVDLKNVQIGRDSIQLVIDWAAGEQLPEKFFLSFEPVTYETAMAKY
jgi:hypothetical protein